MKFAALLFALLALPAQDPAPTPAPVIFNATQSARPGDLVSIQGENFGPTPEVWLNDNPSTLLPTENCVPNIWVSVRIPTTATGALRVRVKNGTATSDPVDLNRATPLHLDATRLAPGGRFRVFGRNLSLPGCTPRVTVNGKPATLHPAESDEHTLTCSAPADLDLAIPRATITVDNGNGSGPATLDRRITVNPDAAGDPYDLHVGWTGAYTALTKVSLAAKVAADGQQDDAAAIQAAIDQVSAAGGGTVSLPEGTLRIAKTVTLKSRCVLQGAGKDKTTLLYEKTNYPVWASGFDLVAVRRLTLRNGGVDVEGPLLKGNTRVVLQDVRFDLGVSQQIYLSGNRDIVVQGCDFLQAGTIRGQGPYQLSTSAGLVFTRNTTTWKHGAPSFQESHDSYIGHNTWTRDASVQNTPIVTTHCCVIDFCSRVAVVGNTFDVINGPITNRDRNDGETLLTEGGGGKRTENLGAVATATADTLTDPANAIDVHPFDKDAIPENYGVAIVDGRGAGQTRRVTAYASKTLTVDRPWDVVPDATSRYATFVWGLEKSLLKGNTLIGNPRGIWLYHCAIRDVDVVGNTLKEGGGIFLRTWQSVADKQFTPHYNVRIAGNAISNTTGVWVSHIASVFVLKDPRPFGIGQLGLEVRDNRVTANEKNLQLNAEDYAGLEGVYMLLKPEIGKLEPPALPPFLGAIFERNTVVNADVAFRLGTGAAGTTFSGNTAQRGKEELTDSPVLPGMKASERTSIRR